MLPDEHAVSDSRPSRDPIKIITPIKQYTSTDQDRIRVLHVDDEPAFLELTASVLEQLSDEFLIMSETRVEDGIDRLVEESVDCIVSDYQMPRTTGLAFLEAVRDHHPQLPFILFTGRGSEEIASEAIANGVTEYLQKTTGTTQYKVLANRIRNAVNQYRTEQELWTILSWYQRLVEQELAGIYLIQDEEFIYVNIKFADIFGYTQEELIGASPLRVITEDDHEKFRENLRQQVTGDVDNIRYTLTGKRKDGRQIDLDIHGGVIEFEGEPAVMGLLLDITE